MNDLINFLNLIINNPLESILLLLIILVSNLSIYKKSKLYKRLVNFSCNLLCLKRKYVIFTPFNVKVASIDNIKNEYAELGYKNFKVKKVNRCRNLNDMNLYSEKIKTIKQLVNDHVKIINKAKLRKKAGGKFIYSGFPHIPLSLLDGYLYSNTDNEFILYHYNDGCITSQNRGFFELCQVYNDPLKMNNNLSTYNSFEKEVALKVEITFPISDKKINGVVGNKQIVTISSDKIDRNVIYNYSQVDSVKRIFKDILTSLDSMGVEKIHLFITASAVLTFSLGTIIEHFHPEIIIYNYNVNCFDWAINLKDKEPIALNGVCK